MKSKPSTICCLFLLIITAHAVAQRGKLNYGYINFDAATGQLNKQTAFGIQAMMLSEISKSKVSAGLSVERLASKSAESFGLTVANPHVSYFSLAVPVAYRLTPDNSRFFTASIFSSFGWAAFTLTDQNVVTGESSMYGKVYKVVSNNNNLVIQPGILLNYRFLNAQIAYRFVAGNTNFSTTSALSGFELKAGLGLCLRYKK